MHHYTRRLLPLLLLLALAACTGNAKRPAGPEEARTTVRVQNRNWLDMNIYVLRSGGQRIRLGTVTGSSTRTFTIPRSLIFGATSLRFLADPIGSSLTPISQEITVYPGDEVGLILPPG